MTPLCTYHAFYRGKRIQVQATTSLQAQDIAAAKFGAGKRWQVTVLLVGRADGSSVTHQPHIKEESKTK
jgi:hypothetical protein